MSLVQAQKTAQQQLRLNQDVAGARAQAPEDLRASAERYRRLQQAIHEGPVMVAQRRALAAAGLRPGPRPEGGVVQRLITVDYDAATDRVTTTQDEIRPPGPLPGGAQGDHTCPYSVLQDQVANAIEGTTLAAAWANLWATYLLYQTLPGWADSRVTHLAAYTALLSHEFTLAPTPALVQIVTSRLLYLRNGLALTSIPGGRHGHGEATWRGGLQHQERRIQLGQAPTATAAGAIEAMRLLFDEDRVGAKTNDAEAARMKVQHAISVRDAYPQLSAALGITPAAILHGW